MNILILNWRDIKHPLAGGAEQSLVEHAKYWTEKGAKVQWFSSLFKGGMSHEVIDDIEYIRSGSHFTVHFNAFIYYARHLRNSVDIIIDCFHGIPYFSPFYFPKNKIIALINEPAKDVWYKNVAFPLSSIAYHLEPCFFRLYTQIPFITSAKSIAVELKELGLKNKQISIIPHGVTIARVREESKAKFPTIIYLSQLSPDKGIEDAIYAFSKVQNKNATFWVVGKPISKSYMQKIKRLAKKMNVQKRIQFLGFVSQKEKFKRLQRAWILIHPSIREGWGLNVIEANSCATPAIGYNVTGLRDSIINYRTGLLTKKNNPEALASALDYLLEHQKIREALGKNAKRYAAGFTWEEAGKKSWQLIDKVYEKSK
jgi:glycosyltransferase involved in cell wall biosynthesis